jgi:hypothetical protein
VSIVAFGLGLTLAFSCYSSETADVHLLSGNTTLLLSPPPFSIYGYNLVNGMTDISPRATNMTTPFGIPDQYLLGISGVCRVWQDHNGTTQCTHNLFHETDFLALLRTDSNNSALALGNG